MNLLILEVLFVILLLIILAIKNNQLLISLLHLI